MNVDLRKADLAGLKANIAFIEMLQGNWGKALKLLGSAISLHRDVGGPANAFRVKRLENFKDRIEQERKNPDGPNFAALFKEYLQDEAYLTDQSA